MMLLNFVNLCLALQRSRQRAGARMLVNDSDGPLLITDVHVQTGQPSVKEALMSAGVRKQLSAVLLAQQYVIAP